MTGSLRATLCAGLAALLLLAPALPAAAQALDPNRVNALENQVRGLTGQVEDLTHQLQVLQDQLRRMQQDTDFRFGELQGTPGAAKPKTPAASVQNVPTAAPAQAAEAVAVDGGQQLGAPPAPLGQVVIESSPGSSAAPLDLSSLAADSGATQQGAAMPPAATVGPAPPKPVGPQTQTAMAGSDPNAAPAVVPASTGDPKADYTAAYSLFTANRYDVAEQAFRQFLQQYPVDEQAPDAQYWLGLSLFVRGDYQHAAEEFLTAYKQYPKSRLAAASLLQLGQSQAGLGRPDEACKSYGLALKQYPQMSNALKQRIVNSRATAGC